MDKQIVEKEAAVKQSGLWLKGLSRLHHIRVYEKQKSVAFDTCMPKRYTGHKPR